MQKLITLWGATMVTFSSAPAAFHFFDIQEIYSNGDGSVQFVELFTTFGNQQFLDGHTLTYEVNNVTSQTVTLATNLPGNTANKTFLVGTSNLGPLYGVTPDYVMPANFLSAGASGTINFAEGTDIVSLFSLPTNGVMSLDGMTNDSTPSATSLNAQATPRNFAGMTVTIPEPATLGALAAGAALLMRRRR